MTYGLMLVPERSCEHTVCFSQRMWQNMMKGRKPQGGKVVLNRDPEEWLSPNEIDLLTGIRRPMKARNSEYLCIQTPKTAMQGAEIKTVNASYNLTASVANELVDEMRRRFVCTLVIWVQNEMASKAYEGYKRDIATCVDHFTNHYNMMIGALPAERDVLRRMARRWMDDVKLLPDNLDEETNFVYSQDRRQGCHPVDFNEL